jgi:myosin-5
MNPFQRVTIYGPEIIQAYSGRRRGDLEPHLFAIAEDAYTAMRKDGTGQTIIVSGERCVSRSPHELANTLVVVRVKPNP